MQSLVFDIAQRFKLRKGNRRFSGRCPKCGGSEQSTRFVLRDDGGFKCYACPFKGDIITFLREIDGHTCPDAHELAGLSCRSSSCPVSGNCRLGSGPYSGRRVIRRRLQPPPAASKSGIPTASPRTPEDLWRTWAADFVAECTLLLVPADVMSYLASRGIPAPAVVRFGLGWSRRNIKVNRAKIGLPPGREGKPTLWLPLGLVISILDESGHVHRIRIRRPPEETARFLSDLKYYQVEGSGTAPMVIRPAATCRGAVVVEAELDAIAIAAAHPEVMVISSGTASISLPAELREELAALPVILVALDAKGKEDGKRDPGPLRAADWERDFPRARYWPVPKGKDAGDYVKDHHGNLRNWIEAGLIPPVKSRPVQESRTSSLNVFPGERGEAAPPDDISLPNRDTGEVEVVTIVAGDGRTIYITNDRQEWKSLAARGKIVFSRNELDRFIQACKGSSPEQAMKILDIKQSFPTAYIHAGRNVAGIKS